MKKLYLIDVGYACAGFEATDGKVTLAAPIFKWMVGKSVGYVRKWVSSKKGTIVEVR